MSSEQLEFAALRSRGIAWLQELTGQRWTDYNLHDPGVTLLETMVYGLTDLAYRIEGQDVELAFSLPPGSYATELVAELFAPLPVREGLYE